MPMDATLQKNCDAFLDGLFSQLRTQQEAYFRASVGKNEDGTDIPRGKYWQGLRINEQRVDSTRRASGHQQAWAELNLTLPNTIPCQVEVHEYDGPQGQGWMLIATVTDNNKQWRRVLHYGPESWREHNWLEVAT